MYQHFVKESIDMWCIHLKFYHIAYNIFMDPYSHVLYVESMICLLAIAFLYLSIYVHVKPKIILFVIVRSCVIKFQAAFLTFFILYSILYGLWLSAYIGYAQNCNLIFFLLFYIIFCQFLFQIGGIYELPPAGFLLRADLNNYKNG